MQNVWTSDDALARRCKLSQVGEEKVPPPEPLSSREIIDEYLSVYQQLGGLEALLKQARANPQRFYSELLKILINMEAPKASLAVQINIEQVSAKELEQMSSVEIKQLLLKG